MHVLILGVFTTPIQQKFTKNKIKFKFIFIYYINTVYDRPHNDILIEIWVFTLLYYIPLRVTGESPSKIP